MKNIIIRKPKFLRDDELMQQYIETARKIQREINGGELMDSLYADLWGSWWYYINRAAKVGGFFNTDSFMKWAERENIKLM